MARAYGFRSGEIAVEIRLRPALIPSLTILGLDFAAMLGNAFLVEAVFAWPGHVALRRRGDPAQGPQRHHRHRADHRGIVPDRSTSSSTCMVAIINPRIRYRARRVTRCSASSARAPGSSFSRNPLSAVGLVDRPGVVLGAVFAPSSRPIRDHVGAVVDFANAGKPPSARTSVRHRHGRPRPLHPHRLRLPHVADPRRSWCCRSRCRSASPSGWSPAISAAGPT